MHNAEKFIISKIIPNLLEFTVRKVLAKTKIFLTGLQFGLELNLRTGLI